MTTRKITLTLPQQLIDAAEAAVRTGRARSVSAYVAAAAGVGEARLSLDEVMQRWSADAAPPTAERREQAEAWAQQFMDRNDARHAERSDAAGNAA